MIKFCPVDVTDTPRWAQAVKGGFAIICTKCGAQGPTTQDTDSARDQYNGSDPQAAPVISIVGTKPVSADGV